MGLVSGGVSFLAMAADLAAVGFRHRLIREAAYAMLTRADRARLHEQHADWLNQLPPALAGPASQASHLEKAHEHLLAIGDPGNRAAAIAARAGRLLTDAARQAHRSENWPQRPDSWSERGGCSGRSQPRQRNCCRSWPPRSSRRERSTGPRTSPRSVSVKGRGSGCPRCAGDPPWNWSERAPGPGPGTWPPARPRAGRPARRRTGGIAWHQSRRPPPARPLPARRRTGLPRPGQTGRTLACRSGSRCIAWPAAR